MRKSNLFSIICETVSVIGMTFIAIRKGWDWICITAVSLNIIAIVLNIVTWNMGDNDSR